MRHGIYISISILAVAVIATNVAAIVTWAIPDMHEPVVFSFHNDAALGDTTQCVIKGNTAALAPVFEKMRLLRKGDGTKLSVIHLGDSHIQAGFLTGAIRSNIQNDFGNAGRGLIVPLRLSDTNEPRDYAITSANKWTASKCAEWTPLLPVGLGGAVIGTNDSDISFTITSNEPFSQVTVFHHPQAPFIKEDPELSTGIICDPSGESATQLVLNSEVTAATLRAQVTDTAYAKPIYYGFSLENGHSGVLYHSIGINGACYTHYNRSPQVISSLPQLDPDLIIVSLGTNDAFPAKFSGSDNAAQIKQIISAIRRCNPDAAILLTTPMEFHSSKRSSAANRNVTAVRGNLIEAAEENGLPYIDMYEIAGGKGAMKKWLAAGMAQADKIHLTQQGYQLWGDMLYQAFINGYNTFFLENST